MRTSGGFGRVRAGSGGIGWYKNPMRLPIIENGLEVSYLEASISLPDGVDGVSATVLYMHGFGSSQGGEKAEFFRRQATAAGLAFWSFDFQGHGASGGGMRDLSLSRNLADVDVVRAEMGARGVSRVILMGSSFGGLTGLWHSARCPEGIEAGLYIAPALGIEQAFREREGEDGLARWRRDGVFEVINELGSRELGWGFVKDLRSYPNEELALRLETPSQLLQGKLDDRVSWRDVLDLAAGCRGKGVELHLFADGDHRMIDRKRHLWDLMLAFLRSRGLVAG